MSTETEIHYREAMAVAAAAHFKLPLPDNALGRYWTKYGLTARAALGVACLARPDLANQLLAMADPRPSLAVCKMGGWVPGEVRYPLMFEADSWATALYLFLSEMPPPRKEP